MKKVLFSSLLTLALAIIPSVNAFASTYYPTGSVGVDVSYPNCSTKIPAASFGIVGVNGGRVYNYNPCLAAQAKSFKDLSLYINTGLNASTDSPYYVAAQQGCNGDALCAAYNYGYSAAIDSVNYATSQGVSSVKWWLDVEIENTWNSDVQQNRQSIQGAYDALTSRGAQLVGAYSTTAQWGTITGSWKNNWPSWGASTWTTASQAKKYCTGHQFTGGQTLLIQFADRKTKVSQNVAC